MSVSFVNFLLTQLIIAIVSLLTQNKNSFVTVKLIQLCLPVVLSQIQFCLLLIETKGQLVRTVNGL